ncbi:ABC-type lipoprotein export system, ATPase component [Olsenella sp. KH3B4]|uniref:ABC transporter ATP-binding protein/permease n=1 Tax=Olsenella sp. KH3B4 TaxID=1855394 RepID=UPI0008C03515|nr:ABC transporter ATP-binding protein/permease [Olsenella sp. KH3B4]SES77441.1 ABC-type lipoprotein export system, ATPase component [Olsenella sp. KH3B4]
MSHDSDKQLVHGCTLAVSRLSKAYGEDAASTVVLEDISLRLEGPGMVAILGESGCGKTTLLNILGGMDEDYEGELIVNGSDAKSFSASDWDSFHGSMVGFVFQEPRLVSYLSVASNVGLALDAAKDDRDAERRGAAALCEVGLEDFATAEPSTLSGGQAQRVAIARVLVKDPRIVLADEPTGSLDEANGNRVMALLADMAATRLVVVVTHNERLAMRYATRIVRIGHRAIVSDLPNEPKHAGGKKRGSAAPKEVSHPAGRSRKLSLTMAVRHAWYRCGRSAISVVAIALAVAGLLVMIAAGFGSIGLVEGLTTSSTLEHPLVASVGETVSLDSSGAGNDIGSVSDGVAVDDSGVRTLRASGSLSGQTVNVLYNTITANASVTDQVFDVQRDYGIELNLYDAHGVQLLKAGNSVLSDRLNLAQVAGDATKSQVDSLLNGYRLMRQVVVNPEGDSPYEVLAGRMPEAENEVVLITNSRGQILDCTAYALGLLDASDIGKELASTGSTEGLKEPASISFEQILGTTYKVVPTADYYYEQESHWEDGRDDTTYMASVMDRARTLTVVGVVKPSAQYEDAAFGGSLGYSEGLGPALIEDSWSSGVVQAQVAEPSVDVFTGQTFADEASSRGMASSQSSSAPLVELAQRIGLSDAKIRLVAGLNAEQVECVIQQYESDGTASWDSTGKLVLSEEDAEQLREMSDEDFSAYLEGIAPATLNASYAQNMQWLGAVNEDEPQRLRIYPRGTVGREVVLDAVDSFNQSLSGENGISCSSDAQRWVDQVKGVVQTVGYVLVAVLVVALSLAVFLVFSVTYVSALERRGEVALLRALGFSKGRVVSMILTENALLGVISSALGVAAACLVIPQLEGYVAQVADEVAHIGADGAVVVTPLLALIAAGGGVAIAVASGLIPALGAAERDPVEVLRVE